MRAEGLRVGLYYSLSDWHHPDYPAFTEEHKPYLLAQSPPFPGEERWQSYLEYLSGHMRELLGNYGPIDVIWFDGGWERPADAWRPQELESLIRSLQPDILINDRLQTVGDFHTPEQFVPARPPAGRWETCMTMNESWGYNPADPDYKSARKIVHTICEVASRGGNLLLNVSPTGSGALPPEQVERLRAVGEWMARNGEAVYDTNPGLEPWQFYGPTTLQGDRVYLHLLMRPYDTVSLRGVPIHRLRGVRELRTGTALEHTTRMPYPELFSDDPHGEVTITVPEDLVEDNATVLVVEVAAG
jgi:alpha-L-fucosidase